MLNNTQVARSDFEAASQQEPNATEPYIYLATVAGKENKLDEAEQFLNRALAIDSLNFDGLYGLIKLYAQQKRLDQAHARIDQALSGQPQNAQLHYLKAQVYAFEMNAQATEAELRKTIELDPNYIAAYTDLAVLFVNLKQTDQAIAEYRRVIERKPDSAPTYTLIGLLEDGRGNRQAAVENYRKALELDPNLTVAANNLAWNYAAYDLGNLDEALRLAQGVVQRFPDAAGFRDTLAWVYYKKGAHVAAVEQLQKVIAQQGNNPVYRYHLGMALAGKGDKAGAKRELETALKLGEKGGFAEADEVRRALSTL
jgi:tetratricopeptide (TPR) repeat protein